MTKVVGYVRVSKADRDKTEEQQRLSIRAQREQITRACEDRGLELVEIFEDFAASGADDDRVNYNAVLGLVASKQAECVVVTRLDRLSRKAWRLLWLVDEQNLDVLALEQCFDTGEPEGWLSAAVHAIMSDYERRLIGKRTSQALRQLVREGKQVGRSSGVPADAEARIVALAAEGLAPSGIAAALASEGYEREDQRGQTQTTWTYKHVQRVLARQVAA